MRPVGANDRADSQEGGLKGKDESANMSKLEIALLTVTWCQKLNRDTMWDVKVGVSEKGEDPRTTQGIGMWGNYIGNTSTSTSLFNQKIRLHPLHQSFTLDQQIHAFGFSSSITLLVSLTGAPSHSEKPDEELLSCLKHNASLMFIISS